MFISQNYSYAILRPLQREILARGGEVRWFFYGDEVNPNFLHQDEIRLLSVDELKDWRPDIFMYQGMWFRILSLVKKWLFSMVSIQEN